MKTKSKLVLGLSILSAATLAAGATSTFAWFQASQGAIGSATEATLNTAQQSKLAALDLTVTWKDSTSGSLEATDFADTVLTDDRGDTYAFNTAHSLVLASLPEGKNRGIVASVEISYTGTNSNLAPYIGSYRATIHHGNDRLKIINGTELPAQAANAYADADPEIYFDFTISLSESTYVFTGATKTFVVAIDGGGTDQEWDDRDQNAVSGTLSVTVAPNAAQ